jgi:hypothetical protein
MPAAGPALMAYRYQPVILEELARFGVFPTAETPPALVHEFISDLYRFELRRLRERLVRGELARVDYADHVVELRRRYPLVSIRPSLWVE